MHELSLVGSILELVEASARREGFSRVETLPLQAGALSGVEVGALRFALDALTPGTCLQGAVFEIDEPAGQAWCLACSLTVTIARRGDACPRCGGYQLQPTGGAELRVVDMLVEDQ